MSGINTYSYNQTVLGNAVILYVAETIPKLKTRQSKSGAVLGSGSSNSGGLNPAAMGNSMNHGGSAGASGAKGGKAKKKR